MANLKKRVAEDVPGDFFVDTTCIDCDACRQIAPAVFGEGRTSSFVHTQPITAGDRRSALRALLACPTGSIGCLGTDDPKEVIKDFPLAIESPVFYCGFNSPKSYGGNSYFIQHAAGNWLIDSPKFVSPLVRQFEALGGIAHIFLTHQDDVADAEKYAHRFNARRIIHRTELAAQPDAEVILEGNTAVELQPDFLAIPTPGHTVGHCCLLFKNRFLFTGDHLAWDRDEKCLVAFHDYCWFSWPIQTESMVRLSEHSFEWILPGHGQRVHLARDEVQRQMRMLIDRMQSAAKAT